MRILLRLLALMLIVVMGCSKDNPTETPPSAKITAGELVLITAGSFEMGAPADEMGFLGDEAQHPVTLTNDIYMFSTEVTNRQYADLAQWALAQGYCTVTGTSLLDNLDGSTLKLLDMYDDGDCEISFNGTDFVVDAGRDNHPVVEVRWFGAAAYCDWLSLSKGLLRAYNHEDPNNWKCNDGAPYDAQGYRLPTEAEWEYSCRAGTVTAFVGGGISEAACGDEASLIELGVYCGNAGGWSHQVGSLNANGFGLYDMHGNVWEWCNDWYRNTNTEEVTDPVGPPPGWYKVLRGGAWNEIARRCRSASRLNPSPHKGIDGRRGFRYVITAIN